MKVLVLGGTGAMGRPLVQQLADEGNEVAVTSRHEHDSQRGVSYLVGDAHDMKFLAGVFGGCAYDAVVDFMIYDSEAFRERCGYLLGHTGQYVFLSSSRVYAESDVITEDSPRLLDASDDREYLATDEYALAKAREENVLFDSGKSNWTIIRPYITYNTQRLQLGTLEKERWLRRALDGRPIVLDRKTARAFTSLTYGGDVSRAIAGVIGRQACLGVAFHVVNENPRRWSEILGLYLDVLEKATGKRLEVRLLDDFEDMALVIGNRPQMVFDRHYDRRFDSSKIRKALGGFEFQDVDTALAGCLESCLEEGPKWLYQDWKFEGFADRASDTRHPIGEIPGGKDRARYLACRYISTSVLATLRGWKNR